MREDGNDHSKAGHHQGDAADQERQRGGDRARLFSRGSRNWSCSHHLLQRDGDGTIIEEPCSHLLHPFLLAYITCNLQVSSIYIFFLTFPKPEITRRASQMARPLGLSLTRIHGRYSVSERARVLLVGNTA